MERLHDLHVDVYNFVTEGVSALLELVAHNFCAYENQKLETFGVYVVDILQESHRIALLFADLHN